MLTTEALARSLKPVPLGEVGDFATRLDAVVRGERAIAVSAMSEEVFAGTAAEPTFERHYREAASHGLSVVRRATVLRSGALRADEVFVRPDQAWRLAALDLIEERGAHGGWTHDLEILRLRLHGWSRDEAEAEIAERRRSEDTPQSSMLYALATEAQWASIAACGRRCLPPGVAEELELVVSPSQWTLALAPPTSPIVIRVGVRSSSALFAQALQAREAPYITRLTSADVPAFNATIEVGVRRLTATGWSDVFDR